jgi:hypothetical protein
VYSAGATLYEALTGRPPFQAESNLAAAMLRLTKDPTPPRALRPGIPRALEAIVMRALARDPDARFASAEDMAAALARLDIAAAAAATPRAVVESATPRPGVFRSWMLIPLIAILAAGVAITVGLLVGALQVGGPLGIQPKQNVATVLKPVRVSAFDPLGDGQENDSQVPLVTDGNPRTFWESENYNELDFGGLKPGLGLLFALRKRTTVTGFRLVTPDPGYRFQIRVGNSPAALENEPGSAFKARRNMRVDDLRPARGRFVLLWMTDVVPTPTGNRDTVAEFRILGRRG